MTYSLRLLPCHGHECASRVCGSPFDTNAPTGYHGRVNYRGRVISQGRVMIEEHSGCR